MGIGLITETLNLSPQVSDSTYINQLVTGESATQYGRFRVEPRLLLQTSSKGGSKYYVQRFSESAVVYLINNNS